MSRATRRRERQERRQKASQIPRLPWRNITNPYPPIEVIDQDALDRIENAAFTILETDGMNFLDEDARRALKSAGADVRKGWGCGSRAKSGAGATG